MIRLNLPSKDGGPLDILCLGAHSDDIEIGCGGSLVELARDKSKAKFYWVVFTATGVRRDEAQKAADLFTSGCQKEVILKDFRDGFLPYSASHVKDFFEELKSRVNPDLIFTHCQGDAHQDHRLICELTWNTFRNHLILEYEIPKYDGDLGRPNVFVALEKQICERKADNLLEAFASQRKKAWFERETFLSLMRLRGMEANSPSGYAEAFYARKLAINLPR